MTISPTIDRKRVRLSHSQYVQAKPEAIFPLLCPVREYDWIPTWDCKLVFTESGLAELGCVFQTDRDSEGGLDTWVVSRFEPSQRISFVRMNDLRVIQYDIRLQGESDGSTTLGWEQTITALTDEGDEWVSGLSQGDFAQMIETLESMLQHYLVYGEALEVAH